MAWSYSGDPASSLKDRLRFEIGDVIAADPVISDEELNFCLAQNGNNVKRAKATAAEAIAARYAHEVNTKVGPLNFDLAQRAKEWAEKAQRFRREAAGAAAPSAGGIYDSSGALSDPYFKKGMHDNLTPETGTTRE